MVVCMADAATKFWTNRHRTNYAEFSCIYPQPGCNLDVLPWEWRNRAEGILAHYRADRMEGNQKQQGCCCEYGNHRLLDEAEAQKLREEGFLVENDSESMEDS